MSPSEGTVLASGEEVVRRYSCTAVDRVAMFAGSVVPLPGHVESEGVLTLTNKRIIFELTASDRSTSSDRQEARLSDVSSISSMMSKFGRDLRVPILLVAIGFLMMFAPFVALSETGAMDHDMDYQDGYNYGVEYGYFWTYLGAVQSGTVSHQIPDGYHFTPAPEHVSDTDSEGYKKGYPLGVERANADIAADAEFSIPTDLQTDLNPAGICIAIAIAGAAVFIMGSVVYLVSNRTKDWISLNLGNGGSGIVVKSFNGGWQATGHRALTAENQYWDMTRELGAAILETRGYRERRLRVVEEDDDVVIGEDSLEEQTAVREEVPTSLLERAPDFDDYGSGELIIEDDDEDDGPRIVGPWRE